MVETRPAFLLVQEEGHWTPPGHLDHHASVRLNYKEPNKHHQTQATQKKKQRRKIHQQKRHQRKKEASQLITKTREKETSKPRHYYALKRHEQMVGISLAPERVFGDQSMCSCFQRQTWGTCHVMDRSRYPDQVNQCC